MGGGPTLAELLASLDRNGVLVLASGVGFAFIGTAASFVGRAGKTDEDGRFVASLVVAFAGSMLVLELMLLVAYGSRAVTDVGVALLLAPPVCFAATLFGVSRVFPLRSLAGFRRMMAAAGLGALTLALLWLLSRFHWGVVFWGGLAQLGLLFLVIALTLRALYRRAFGRE